MALMTVIFWHDRYPERSKDAEDLLFLMVHYQKVRIKGDRHIPLPDPHFAPALRQPMPPERRGRGKIISLLGPGFKV